VTRTPKLPPITPPEVSDGQMLLEIEPMVRPTYVSGATIQERYEAFRDLNPWVLEALETMTERYLSSGRRRLGIGMLVEVLRWHHDTATTGDAFKLNNDYRSRFVREMIARHPEWSEVFSLRDLTTA
jgi:hypothetical protein